MRPFFVFMTSSKGRDFSRVILLLPTSERVRALSTGKAALNALTLSFPVSSQALSVQGVPRLRSACASDQMSLHQSRRVRSAAEEFLTPKAVDMVAGTVEDH